MVIADSSKYTRFEWLGAAVIGSRSCGRAAEEHHRPRDVLQQVAEVLGAHHRMGELDHPIGADDVGRHR